MENVSPFCTYVSDLIKSGHQIIHVNTVEEGRALDDIRSICEGILSAPGEAPWRLITWDFARGFSVFPAESSLSGKPIDALNAIPSKIFDVPESLPATFKSTKAGTITAINYEEGNYFLIIDDDESFPVALPPYFGPVVTVGQRVSIDMVVGAPFTKDAVFVIKDPAVFMNTHEAFSVRRALRNLVESQALSNGHAMRPIILLGAVPVMHDELNTSMIDVPYALPSPQELVTAVNYIANSISNFETQITPEFRHRMSDAMRGFSMAEAKDTLAYIIRKEKGFGNGDAAVEDNIIREIHRRKRDKWAKEDAITLVDSATLETFDVIGGYCDLKSWIAIQKMRFTEKARELGVNPPKGIVLGGVPGTGKSLIATVIAQELRLPLVIMKVDAMFGSLVGESESRMRNALRKIQALGPCVVLIDEADKCLAGMQNNSNGDSGVSSRVFSQFLSWQANENKEAFVIMTLNRIKGLSPELLRTGRFNRIWWVDVPTDEERKEIFEIHLRKRGIDPKIYSPSEMASLIEYTRDAVGSDIENIVEEARSEALFETNCTSATPTFSILNTLSKECKPTARTDNSSIDEIRDMFQGKAYPVSNNKPAKTRATKQRQVSVRNN